MGYRLYIFFLFFIKIINIYTHFRGDCRICVYYTSHTCPICCAIVRNLDDWLGNSIHVFIIKSLIVALLWRVISKKNHTTDIMFERHSAIFFFFIVLDKRAFIRAHNGFLPEILHQLRHKHLNAILVYRTVCHEFPVRIWAVRCVLVQGVFINLLPLQETMILNF